MVALAQPASRDARDLLEAAYEAERDTGVAGCETVLEHLLFNPAVLGNVMAMQLLWTAEPSTGFEQEDILTLSRLEELYPELWPVRPAASHPPAARPPRMQPSRRRGRSGWLPRARRRRRPRSPRSSH